MLKNKVILIFITLFYLNIGLFAQNTQEAQKEVSGHVYNASTGDPIEGISISVKGFSSAITKEGGSFKLKIPNDMAVLKVGGLSYQTTEEAIKGRSNIDIYLHDFGYSNMYSEIDMSYWKSKKAYTTQSLTSVNAIETGWKMPSISPEKVFEGRIAGLNVFPRSGNLGIGSNIFLRGFSSMYATNQPLIIVDGMIFDNESYGTSNISGYRSNPLADISINDIESVSIVKDAASIYGAKAANGVIFIRTTHAYNMATKIEVSAYGGMNQTPDQIPLLNAAQYRPYVNELLLSYGIDGNLISKIPFMIDDESYADYYRYHNDENWQEKVFADSYNQNYNLKITGGDDIALYALSIGYLMHDGIVKNTDFSRLNMRFNSDINITQKMKMNANIGVTNSQRNLMPDGLNYKTNPYLLSLRKAPFLYERVRSSTGIITPNLEDADIFGVSNPVALTERMAAGNRNYRIFGSFNINYKFNDAFSISNLIGINFGKMRDNLFVPHLGVADETLDLGVASNEMGHRVERIFGLNNDLNIKYQKRFNHQHGITAMGGMRMGSYNTQEDSGTGYNSPNDEMRSVGTGNILLRKVGGYIGNWNWLTYYANAEYDFNMKYFLSVGTSLDASSRFGDEANGVSIFSKRFGFFPSVSSGWLISSENFMADIKKINLLKLRASYGLTGNDDIGNYTAKRYYQPQAFIGAQGLVAGNIGNPKLQWETNSKMNMGLDLIAFRERLNASFDFFRNKTDNMLNYVPLSSASGYSYFIENNGSFNSKGFDFTINGRIINSGVKLDLGLVFSNYKTEVTNLAENEVVNTIAGANILTRVGKELNLFYGYQTNGVFTTTQEAQQSGLTALIDNTVLLPFGAGDVHFTDIDGNKIIDKNDQQIIGNPNPDFTGMVTTTISWKGISLDAGLSFTYGNDVYNQTRYMLESMQNFDNQTPAVLNRWRTEGQITDIPKSVLFDPIGNARFSDRWIEDGSFMRLKYVTLSYKIHNKLIKNAEVFLTGQNLFTLTGYKGLDPEFSLSGSSLSQGIDIGMTPQTRSMFFGFRLGL